MRRWPAGGVMLLAMLAGGRARALDEVEQARAFATGGRRPEAIALLRSRLTTHPADGDARVLLGIYLSWEGEERYDEARAALRAVLAATPDHGDALPALMNLELWDGHPERAEALGRAATAPGTPVRPAVFVAEARALAALNRVHDALPLVQRVLVQEPGNDAALALKQRLDERARSFEVGTSASLDFFDDSTEPWREYTVALKGETSIGSIIARASRAHRFGDDDNLFELEAYPRLRRGTYAYLDVGMGQHRLTGEAHALYPKLRLGADLYQSLGLGFELSLGMRRLQFDAPVNIFVGSLTKYWGSWMFTARSYVTPGDGGVSVSGHGIVRWYFGGEGTNYLGLRYAHGLSREIRTSGDAALLDSNTVALDASAWITRRFEIFGLGMVSQSERLRASVRQYSTSAGLGWRF